MARREEVGGRSRPGRGDRQQGGGGGARAHDTGRNGQAAAQSGREGQQRAEGHEAHVRVEERPEGARGAGEEKRHAERRPEREDDGRGPPETVERRPVAAGKPAQGRGGAEAQDHVQADIPEVQEARVGARRQVQAVQAQDQQRAGQHPLPSLHPASSDR